VAQTRTTEQIRADIAAARQRLAAGVEGLVTQAHPAAMRREAVGAVKAKAQGLVGAAKAEFIDEAGVRWNRLGTIILVVKGVVIVILVAKGLGRLVRR